MALSIQEENARLTVDGKSWDDVATDSGGGMTIDQITIAEIEEITGIDLPDIDDDTHIIVGYEDGEPVIYIDDDIHDEPFDLDDLDLDDFDLDWELDTEIAIDGVLVSVDVDLNIKKDDLPTYIEIVTQPYKLTYYDGQTIDVTGMRVVPKRENGSTWTNSKYFRGYIPLQEIAITPNKADKDEVQEGKATSNLNTSPIPKPIPYDTQLVVDNEWDLYDTTYYAAPAKAITGYKTGYRGYYQIYASDEPFTLPSFGDSVSMTYSGKTVHYHSVNTGTQGHVISLTPDAYPGHEYADGWAGGNIAWTIIFGEKSGGKQVIAVSWNRYGDGLTLAATFEISVEENGGSGR